MKIPVIINSKTLEYINYFAELRYIPNDVSLKFPHPNIWENYFIEEMNEFDVTCFWQQVYWTEMLWKLIQLL